MNSLAAIFIAKICITLVIWAVPLLVLPEKVFVWLGLPKPINIMFLRLLGMAYGALSIDYIFGLIAALKGIYPTSTIWMGVISNGGASIILLTYGLFGYWKSWKIVAQAGMWFFMFATALISIGLIVTGLYPQHF
jgi:hypothetical protein